MKNLLLLIVSSFWGMNLLAQKSLSGTWETDLDITLLKNQKQSDVFIRKDIFSDKNYTKSESKNAVPFSKIFNKFGTNSLGSLTYNYGANYLVAGAGTYGMVKSGFDWEWSNMAVNNKALTYSGMPFGALGFVLPVAVPMAMYINGRNNDNAKTQIAGLALGQAAIQGIFISSAIKTFTGRRHPGILNPILGEERDVKDFSDDFAFGFMERGVFDGWPSSHTTVIFAMAMTLAELYPENKTLKISAYSYAILTAIGMSLTVHWASDAFAGALIGYSIGKSVGRSYYGLTNQYSNEANGHRKSILKGIFPGLSDNISCNILPRGFILNYNF